MLEHIYDQAMDGRRVFVFYGRALTWSRNRENFDLVDSDVTRARVRIHGSSVWVQVVGPVRSYTQIYAPIPDGSYARAYAVGIQIAEERLGLEETVFEKGLQLCL